MSGGRFLLATRSEGKLRELRHIFSDFGLQVVDLVTLGIPESAAEDDLEQFETFEENAIAKARYFFQLSGGIPTFGDDSGMCVDALGGEPGVFSKRWSGREDLDRDALDAANNAKLTARMR
ncbi:MAG TPA: non-canonical purine NTP pyrophosphatase, partial [Gemmatimonadaceae bacterium]|nr:non-canonical purine NTP pyrophosphatase [Gemmatimonadaceae bacterium]